MNNYPRIWFLNLVLYISFLLFDMRDKIFLEKTNWGFVLIEALTSSFLLALMALVVSMTIAAFPVRQKTYWAKIQSNLPYVTLGCLLVMLVSLLLVTVSDSSPI